MYSLEWECVCVCVCLCVCVSVCVCLCVCVCVWGCRAMFTHMLISAWESWPRREERCVAPLRAVSMSSLLLKGPASVPEQAGASVLCVKKQWPDPQQQHDWDPSGFSPAKASAPDATYQAAHLRP